MELNQLNYFRTVARLENVTKAAEELHVSQPNLSTSIARLESDLGVQLFTRSKGRISLTESGRVFLHHTDRIFQELEVAELEIRKKPSYRFEFIAVASNFSRILPALFGRFFLECDLIPSTQMLYDDDILIQKMLDHQLDVAVVQGRINHPDLVWEPVTSAGLAAVLKCDNPYRQFGTLSMRQLRQEHFICNELYFSAGQMLELGRNADCVPNIVRVSNEAEVIDDTMLDFGDNIIICPLYAVPQITKDGGKGICFRKLNDYYATIPVGLLWPKSHVRNEQISDFINYARNALPDIIGEQCQLAQDLMEHDPQE